MSLKSGWRNGCKRSEGETGVSRNTAENEPWPPVKSTGPWGRGEGGSIPKGSDSTDSGGEQGQEPQEAVGRGIQEAVLSLVPSAPSQTPRLLARSGASKQ